MDPTRPPPHLALTAEHVNNSMKLSSDLARLDDTLSIFSKLTRQLADAGALPTVLRLVSETVQMLQGATGAAKVYVYMHAGKEGFKATFNPEDGGTIGPNEAMQAEAKRVAFAHEASGVQAAGLSDPTRVIDESVAVERTVVHLGHTQLEILTQVVVMPSHHHIAAFRQPPKRPGGTKGSQRASSLHNLDEEASADAEPPGACLAMLQLCGKVGSLSSLMGGDLNAEPYNKFSAGDERALGAVGRAFGVLMPAIRARERRDDRAAKIEAEAEASRRSAAIVANFTEMGGGANTLEELFALARGFAEALPAVSCHLFLVDNIEMTPGHTPAGNNRNAATAGGGGGGGSGAPAMAAIPPLAASPSPGHAKPTLKGAIGGVMGALRLGGKFDSRSIEGLVQVAREPGGRDSQELFSIPTLGGDKDMPASLEAALASNVGAKQLESSRVSVRLGPGVLGACAIGGKPILLRNANVDQRFESSVDEALVPLPVVGRHAAVMASMACVPLHDRTGSVVGVLQAMGDEEMVMTESHILVMKLLAHLLSTNLQLLKVNSSEPAGLQVAMQRANAALQQEARELRDDILQKRRALHEASGEVGGNFKPRPAPTLSLPPSKSAAALVSSMQQQLTTATPSSPTKLPPVASASKAPPHQPPASHALKGSSSLPNVTKLTVQELRRKDPSPSPSPSRVPAEASTVSADAASAGEGALARAPVGRPVGRFLHPDQVSSEGASGTRSRTRHPAKLGPGDSMPPKAEESKAPTSERRDRHHPTRLGLGESHAFGADRRQLTGVAGGAHPHKAQDAPSPTPAAAKKPSPDKSPPPAEPSKPPVPHSDEQGRKRRDGDRRGRAGGLDADMLWDDLCRTVRDL